MIRFLLVIFGVVAGLFAAIWFAQTAFFDYLTDRTPPVISMEKEVPALGTERVPFEVRVTDDGLSGTTLSGSLKQNHKEMACQVSSLVSDASVAREGKSMRSFGVVCDPVEAAFVAGRATVLLNASDNSIWENQAEKAFSVELDFSPPEIEILTQQHSVRTGGSELVIFQVRDNSPVTGSVRVGAREFGAVSARVIDPSFPDLIPSFVSVFALPLDWDPSQVARVHVADSAGNQSEVPLRFRVEQTARQDDDITLSREFIEGRVQPLLAEYELFLRRMNEKDAQHMANDFPPPEDLEGRFRVVNEKFRGLLDAQLLEIFSRVTPEKLWQGHFARPMAAKLSSNFGDRRSYFFEDKPFGTSEHMGFDMASTERDIVRATNEGIVRLSQDFGLYGNSIVVDHGLGVFSFYGHLSVVQVRVGDRVLKGDIIGRTGMTGFAAGDHLHFELRVHGVPVSPIEWWDPKWYQDDVEGKVTFAKSRL